MSLRFLTILAVLGLAEYYSFIVVRSAISNMPSAWRIILLSLYLLMTVLAWLGLILFRQIHWENLPHLLRNIYVAFVFGFTVGKLLILLVMLIDDIRRGIMWIIERLLPAHHATETGPNTGISRSVFLKRLALIAGGTSVAGFLYGVNNRYNYHIRRVKLQIAALPKAFRGLKIVQVSDIHTGSFDNHDAVAHGIDKILKEKPDIIFFTGDLVNNHAYEVDRKYQEIYSRLNAPMGVYSILGNHDYGARLKIKIYFS